MPREETPETILHQYEDITCAKEMVYPSSPTRYFAKLDRSDLFDPRRAKEFHYRKREWKFERVTKQVFDQYILFLQTDKDYYLTQAHRNL